MTTTELLEKIRDALAGSAAISTWSTAKYGSRPTVYVGINEEQPPPAEEYPIIALIDCTEIRGNTSNMQKFEVGIGCGIINETIETDAEAGTKTHAGMLDVEDLRELVEGVLTGDRFAKITFSAETGAINSYPVFVSYTIATVELINSRRRQ